MSKTRSASSDEPIIDFGFRQIPFSEKQARVNGVFSSVASRYDVMNDVMSAGLHRLWKDALVTTLRPPKSAKPFRLLDLAGGTGDIATRVLARGGSGVEITVADINPAMLEAGQDKNSHPRIEWVNADAQVLPFEDASFDAVSIAFGIRNVPDRAKALREILRVLKPQGTFACLEFSAVDLPVFDKIYDFYSFEIIPRLGGMIASDEEAYRYLVESIRRFPSPVLFSDEIGRVGFSRTRIQQFSGGIVAIHSAKKE